VTSPEPECAPEPPGLSYIQRFGWAQRRDGAAVAATARALRLRGAVDAGRIEGAIDEVTAALDILRTGFAGPQAAAACGPAVRQASVSGPPADRDRQCAAILRRDRDRLPDPARDPLVRFHLIQSGAEETVLGLVADPLILDLRSVYLVLGAVMQAYFGRFRAAQYPPYEAVAGLNPAARPGLAETRNAWWATRIRRWQETAGRASPGRPAGPEPAAGGQTIELGLAADRWAQLARGGGGAGNAGSLAVIALLTHWCASAFPRPPVFASTLDLRDYADLGPVVGPLTDQLVFAVDLDGYAGLTFRDLVGRAHAGLLDAVVHYVPYADVRRAAAPAPPAAAEQLWDIAIHYCRAPPASGYTRGDESLARQGLSIELFCESVLVGCDPGRPGRAGHGSALEVHMAESGSGMALVINFDSRLVSASAVTGLLAWLDPVVTAVTADPGIRLSDI
jgi:hypothetical protein